MFEANLMAFIFTAVSIVILVIVNLVLSVRHDKYAALQGPLEEVQAVEARIKVKRETLDDLEQELEKRRAALANLADIRAEVDAMLRQKEELQHEWSMQEEKRAEIMKMREEASTVRTEMIEAEGALAAAKGELGFVQERLERAEALVERLSELEERKVVLQAEIETMADKRAALEEAERKLSQIQNQQSEIEGRTRVRQAELSELDESLSAKRRERAELDSALDSENAELWAARQSMITVTEETERLSASIAGLEARKTTLESKIKGMSSTGGATEDDPMRELKTRPPVVDRLVEWPQKAAQPEPEALAAVKKRFDAYGLTYPARTLSAFHTSMKVNDTTQMTVLAGISGTGKSQLPRQYAAGMGIGFLQVPVQPRWDSPQDLMGFYNYIEGRFRPTDLARALYALDEVNNTDAVHDRMMMVLLDEMNLARVEYYFSDFLSRLESRPARKAVGDKNLRKDAEIELEIPNAITHIFPGYNLLFAGTMNEDESTQSLSDKVVDRANVLRFGAPKKISNEKARPEIVSSEALSRSEWDKWCSRELQRADATKTADHIQIMLQLMQDFGKPFGHRLGKAIAAYVAAYPETEGFTERSSLALADQIEMRLLPKLRGVDVEEKSAEFDKLVKLASENFQDDALAEAIRKSVDDAELTGQFVWKGVIR